MWGKSRIIAFAIMLPIPNGLYLYYLVKKKLYCPIMLSTSQCKPYFASEKIKNITALALLMDAKLPISLTKEWYYPDSKENLKNPFQQGTCAQPSSEVSLKWHTHEYTYCCSPNNTESRQSAENS